MKRIHTNTNQLVTGYVQTALYAILIRAGDPKPAPGSPRFVRDRRRIHIFVIVVYLLYTVYEADYQLRLAGDFYQDLGVAHDVAEKAVQSRFRRLYVDPPIKITFDMFADMIVGLYNSIRTRLREPIAPMLRQSMCVCNWLATR